ncbi:MAG: DPP IV N-terminal domain-containing protein [Silvibacterium sp.]|nr:DPP IV N-terminal domain-containing protein [Silvibacterium sp.]MBV8436521.1 DPP IV N-terminal domain-containing protein [Silvibacterium sp.]
MLQQVHWNPSGMRVAWLQTSPKSADPRSHGSPVAEIEVIDVSNAQRSVLVSGDKIRAALEAAAPPRHTEDDRRHPAPPPQLTGFAWAGDRALLLITPTSLVWLELDSGRTRVLVSGADAITDASPSPDGRFAGFIRDHALWLTSASTGETRRLTPAGSNELCEGEPDWPYRNDLGLDRAYWWSPDSSKIAYLETDDRATGKYRLRFADGHESAMVYPLPGSALPVVRLYVQAVSGGQRRAIDSGNAVYLPRVSWTPDSSHLAVERLDRSQKVLDLLLADPASGRSRAILTDKNPYWINLDDGPHFLRDSSRFVWSTERSGYRHLYLYDTTGRELAQLTSGEWEVTAVDAVYEGSGDASGLVYFTAARQSPAGLPGIERQVNQVALDGSGLKAVTGQPGTHEAVFSPSAQFFVDTFSTAAAPPRRALLRADGSEVAAINENPAPALAGYKLPAVEFLTVTMHMGSKVNAIMIRPPDFDPSRKYPVIVYVAGGPGEQVVRDMWGGDTFLWLRMMAQKGYVIYAQDGHGTAGRGHVFDEPVHLRFSSQEMSDQRDAVFYLLSLPYVDASRVGIYGWGYGGFLALHGMLDLPIAYKAGIAGAPITDWRLYDAVFAERYLEDPVRNQDGYLNSMPIENAKNLRGPLLIVQGTTDERVHIENSLELLNELLETAKYPSVMFVPDRGNVFEDHEARLALYRAMTEFFVRNL